jgi:hypothetical protein
VDLLSPTELLDRQQRAPEAIPVSAAQGSGFEKFKEALVEIIESDFQYFVSRFKRGGKAYHAARQPSPGDEAEDEAENE